MNSTYRSIWNEALGAWVATSEHTASRGKRASRTVLISAVLMAGGFHGTGWAANECGAAVAGATVNCAPGSYPTGIAYSVDDLVLNVSGTSDVGLSATPVAGVGVSNAGAGAGTSLLTTLGAVNVYTSGNYGYGLYAGATGAGNAVASASTGTSIRTDGIDGAKGILAHAMGTGNASATNNGTILTTGASGLDGNFGVYAVAASGNATAANTGTVATGGTFGYGVYAVANGNGIATATSSGAIKTDGPYSTGIGAHIDNADASKHGTAIATLQSGGTVTTSGSPFGIGIFADVFGHGDAAATNAGTVATQGQFAHGASARVFYGAGDATTVNQGAVSTSGIEANGLYAAVGAGGPGKATAQNSGTVSTTGSGAAGMFALVSTAVSTSTATAIMSGGAISTAGDSAVGMYSRTDGLGEAVATMSGGAIGTTGSFGGGVMAESTNTASTATTTASMSGGTVNTQSMESYGVSSLNRGLGAASATLTGDGAISTAGDRSFGVYAHNDNLASTGAVTATMEGGSINTTGFFGVGVYSLNDGLGVASATMTGGQISAAGNNGHGLYSRNTGSGDAVVTMTDGAIATTGEWSVGVGASARNGAGTATMSGGTVSTTGVRSQGLASFTYGGASSATLTGGGAISTAGDESYGIYAASSNVVGTAATTATLSGGSVSTSGANAHGLYSSNTGTGVAKATVSAGTVTATGVDADGVRASSGSGTYQVEVSGGSVTGGSGAGAAIHVLAAAGGTIDIGAAAVVNGAASGIAIRDGDATGSGTDAVGGDAIVTTAGTVTGDAILGLGNDSLTITGGSFTGNIYGDDRVASANDGNDSFRWTGGTLTGGFYGQNGSDTALVSAPAYNGSQILDGGDDVSTADGWVDRLTLQGVTATAGGAQLLNWESIALDNTRLTLAGDALTVGAGLDAGGTPLGLLINPTSTVLMGSSAFGITGDVHNAGTIDLRNASGVAGNVLTVRGNYAGSNGLLQIRTSLGDDGSATDKLVVNGNTSGSTRLQVTNAGGTGAATVNGIQVVQVTGTSSEGNFALASPVQAGAFEYGLHRGGRTDGDANSFYLSSVYVPAPTPTPAPAPTPAPTPAPAPAPAPAPEVFRPAVPGYVLGQVASNELGLGLLGSLHKRVGEQQTFKWDHCGCTEKVPTDQVWGRLHVQRLDIDGKRQFGSEQDMQFVQFGKDLSISYSGDPGDKSRAHTGLSVGYGRTTTDFGDRRRGDAGMGYDTGKMKGQMATLGAYHTRYADNGSYLDLVGQLHAVHNEYTDKYGGEGTQKGAGFGLSAEVGRPWQIGESQWLIEPQAQLSYQATRYRGFSDNVSSVDGFTGQSLRARLGGRLAWNDKAERADKLTRTNTFYVTANLLHEFLDPEAVTVGGTSVGEDWAKKTWAELGVGAQLPLSKSTYLYGGLQYQRSLGDNSRDGVSGQVGVRVAW